MSSEIKANTISEVTSANGVTIDGLKVKDYSLMYGSNTGLTVNSSGYILKPNLPAFMCVGTASTVTADSKVTGWQIVFNQGNHFDVDNDDDFTAPVDGVYCFTYGLLSKTANTRFEFYIYKNNALHSASDSSPGSGNYDSGGATVLMNLSASDYVHVKNGGEETQNNSANIFGGFLIG